MYIQCTKKLLDRLKLKPEERVEEDAFFSWHANLLTINRRNTVILMNDLTRYVIVLYGLKAKDFSQINSWIVQAIKEVWQQEGIKESVIEKYLHNVGEITFTKTKDRKHVSRLNKATENTEAFSYSYDEGELVIVDGINEDISKKVSRVITTDGNKGYIAPHEELFRELKERYGEHIFSTQAAEMKVTLMLDEHEVYRTLRIPLHRTLSEFHDILQVAFDWTNSHLHEFYIYEKTEENLENQKYSPMYIGEGYKPVMNVVLDESMTHNSETEMEIIQEKDVTLSSLIPETKWMLYHYDFGDSWRHKIEVLQVIDNYPETYPKCIDGEGNAPPEDVGGEGGYDEFLRMMDHPSHPDHESMKQWASAQGYEKFNEFRKARMNTDLKKL